MPSFNIRRPQDAIRLDPAGHGRISFQVTNLLNTEVRAAIDPKPENEADRPLFKVEGGEERTLRPNETQEVVVLVTATDATAAGSHKFWLRVVDLRQPDDNYAESQSVEFQVAAKERHDGKLKFPWWLISAAAFILIAAAGLIWYFHQYPRMDDFRQMNAGLAVARLMDLGMSVSQVMDVAVLDEKTDNLVVDVESDGKSVAPQERLKRGSQVIVHVEGFLPIVTGQTFGVAKVNLKKFPADLIRTVPPIADDANTVTSQTPDPRDPSKKSADGKIVLEVPPPTPPPPPPALLPVPAEISAKYCDAVSDLASKGFLPREKLQPLSYTNQAMNLIVRDQVPPPGPPAREPGKTEVYLIHAGGPLRCGLLRIFGSVTEIGNQLVFGKGGGN